MIQDVFDGKLKNGLELMYSSRVWSEIGDMQSRLIDERKWSLSANHLKFPNEKKMKNRIRNFYSNRRSLGLTNKDPQRKKKRREN